MHGRRTRLSAIASLVIVMLAGAPAHASPGSFDRTFGGDGLVRVPDREFHPIDVAVQPDGQILVLGRGHQIFKVWIARLTPHGRLDRGYGEDGFAPVPLLGSVEESLGGLTVDRQGRAVVAQGEPDAELVVRRYTQAGHPDRSFSPSGSTFTRFPVHFFRAGDPAGGRRISAGGVSLGFDGDAVVTLARFRSDGSLDHSFGGDGLVVRHFCCEPVASEIGEDAMGRLVVGGFRGFAGRVNVVRLKPGGLLDRSFSGDGLVHLPPGVAHLADVAVAGDGGVAVVGTPLTRQPHWRIARYLPDGRLDRRFGGDGIVITRISCRDFPSDALQLDDGRLLVVGNARGCGTNDLGHPVIARYLPDGRLDTSFGRGGLVIPGFPGVAYEPAVQSDRKIVVGLAGRVARLLS
jgi:uncharacterized delta-60 repeat protein